VTSPTRFEIAMAGIALLLSGLTASAQTAPPPLPAQTIGFDQFRAQQLQQLQRAQVRLTQQLGSPSLSPDQQQRLARRQAQLARFTAMPPDQQDRLLHRRFDRIDANHDGAIDPGEFQASRQQHRDRALAKKASGPGGGNGDFWPSQN
jgi:hypothetical protein